MKDALAPLRLHVFVCANRRDPGNVLGPGCDDRGEALYDALKIEVTKRGLVRDTWIAKTHCLGICPKNGATVARYPARTGHPSIETEATLADVDALLSSPSPSPSPSPSRSPSPSPSPSSSSTPSSSVPKDDDATEEVLREVESLEALQRKKVLDLARRLNPKLTLEDVQNPHDFPELDDPDWHYADGVLTGIASVKSALLALLRRRRRKNEDE